MGSSTINILGNDEIPNFAQRGSFFIISPNEAKFLKSFAIDRESKLLDFLSVKNNIIGRGKLSLTNYS